MSTRALVTSLALGGIACGKSTPPPPAAEATAAPAAPADSLVATAPGGAEIWFTLARADSGGAGRCTARAVEIRRGSTRIPVPLLYTSSAPELVNDSTFRARLSDHCLAGDAYLVNLRTGRPVREHP
jgi:Tfp pilus assembly protein FimV